MIAIQEPAGRAAREGGGKFPPQVELILSAIETGQYARRDRRRGSRLPYRTEAKLRLFSDRPETPPWLVYTRDANERGVGFITTHRLPLGYGGKIEMEGPDGELVSVQCTLLRCREAAPGWYEGSLYFNRVQPEFGASGDAL